MGKRERKKKKERERDLVWGREQIWAVGKAKQFDIWSVEDKNIICAKKKKIPLLGFFFFFFWIIVE